MSDSLPMAGAQVIEHAYAVAARDEGTNDV